MGRYYIIRTLFSIDIYILDYMKPAKEFEGAKGIVLTDRELKEMILQERANGIEVNLLWRPLRRGRRKSHFQIDIETRRYNRIMNSDN